MKLKIQLTSADKKYPGEWCSGCGLTMNYLTCLDKFGQPPLKAAFDVSTFHVGTCGVCKRKHTAVTEPRDYFYPNVYKLDIKLGE